MNDDIRKLDPAEFPALFAEIPDGPKHLYLRGNLPSPDTKLLCVVGSRKFSAYGKAACEKFIEGLRGMDVAIVSGLAFGIDAIAHKSAMKSDLKTIAVPGSGLNWDVLYPRAHYRLGREIIENGGAHLSEFDPSHKARPESFPQRNRIMAGMSHATLVVEASEKSGTLITARLALEYNRDVATIPGSIFTDSAQGSNALLRQGAFPLAKPDDLHELLELEKGDETSEAPSDLSDEEKMIFENLEKPKTKDELFEALDMPAQKINIVLSGMEIKGLIKEELGKISKNI